MGKRLVCGTPYQIIRKNVKNINLRVKRDGLVVVSAGKLVSEARIDKFVQSKSDWIGKRLEIAGARIEKSAAAFQNGMTVTLLGETHRIEIAKSAKKKIYICQRDSAIVIETPDPSDSARIEKQYAEWLRPQAEEFFAKCISRYMPMFTLYGIPYPALAVNVMRACWGTCNKRKKLIRLNLKLFKASPACIEYVALHEIAHLVQPNHGRHFYEILAQFMPDHKTRKKTLKTETDISTW